MCHLLGMWPVADIARYMKLGLQFRDGSGGSFQIMKSMQVTADEIWCYLKRIEINRIELGSMEDQLQVGTVPIEISQMWHAWRRH